MNLEPMVETFGSGNQMWLGSAHATNNAVTVTLKVDSFAGLKANHGGIIPSGVPLKKSEEGGTYELLTAASDKLAGFLLTDQPNKGKSQIAPMVWHGLVKAHNLPKGAFDVSTLTEGNPQFSILKNEEV